MSKTIKVEEEVYNRLDEIRDWKETYSQVIEKLLAARERFCQLIDIIEADVKFRNWQREQLEKAETAKR